MPYIKPHQLYRQLKESRKPQRLLGIETRWSCTGFAVTNLDLSTAQPLLSFYAKKPGQLLAKIVKLIEEENIGGCLIGYTPIKHDKPEEFANHARVFRFIDYVFCSEELLKFPFTLVYERFEFSRRQKEYLARKKSDEDRERASSREAACCITKKWLDFIRREIHLEKMGDLWSSRPHDGTV